MYNNFKYIPNWHHKYISNRLTEFILGNKIKKLMLFVPPQHGKSELVSRNLPAFAFGVNPEYKIASCSYSIDLARSFNRDVQRIMVSDTYRDIFPNSTLNTKNTVNTQSYLRNSEEFEVVNHKGYYKAVGVMGGLSGRTVDIAIIDDPVKDALEAYSKTYRDRVWDWYLNVLRTRLHNDSKQLLIMTRWHEDDLAGRILEFEAQEWEVIVLPAICEHPNRYDIRSIGQSLWEERHSLTELLKVKNMSERVFNSLYQQRPTALEGNIIKRQWFGRYNIEEIAGLTVNFVVDTAYSKDSKADYSVILAYTIKNNCCYIVNISQKKLDFPEFLEELKQQVKVWGTKNSIIRVEPKATGKTVVQQIRQQTMLNIRESKAPSTDKVSRCMAVSAIIEGKRVLLLNNAYWLDNFLEETGQFPNGKNDDQVDTMIMMLEIFSKPMSSNSY